eukprot:7828219-Alexandrium_andersonii.AAC.1
MPSKRVTNELLTLAKARASENLADLFTKRLPGKTLKYLRAWAGRQGVSAFSMASPRGRRTSALWLRGVDFR